MKRPSSLSRTSGLKRQPMKRRKRRRARPGRNDAYLRWVRLQPCCACLGGVPPSHAHHTTEGRGIGQKTPDRFAIPLCGKHHDQRHSLNGDFKDWTRGQIREWEAERVGFCWSLYPGELFQ